MNTILIVDLSNILYSSYFGSINDSKGHKIQFVNDKDEYCRYLMLSELLTLKKKFNPKETVLAIDGKNVWRKEDFKYYKARRVFNKQKLPIDWDHFYKISEIIVDELISNYPCKYVKVDRAEADDVIATLTINLKDENKIVIATKDKDMKQLLVYNNVSIYDLLTREMLICDDPVLFRNLHILKGDSGDDIPNLLSDDNVFVCDNKRQKRITQKVINEAIELGIKEYAIKHKLLDNYERNKKLVILDCDNIPEKIQIEIMYQYNTNKMKGDYESLIGYITKNHIYALLEEF